MSTMLSMRWPLSFAAKSTWSSSSPEERLRTRPPMVEAQKLHPMRHPTWLEIQREVPCSYRMSTLSTALPSCRPKRYLMVPSFLLCWRRSMTGAVNRQRRFKVSRSGFERLLISSMEATPLAHQEKICLARNAGSPSCCMSCASCSGRRDRSSTREALPAGSVFIPLPLSFFAAARHKIRRVPRLAKWSRCHAPPSH